MNWSKSREKTTICMLTFMNQNIRLIQELQEEDRRNIKLRKIASRINNKSINLRLLIKYGLEAQKRSNQATIQTTKNLPIPITQTVLRKLRKKTSTKKNNPLKSKLNQNQMIQLKDQAHLENLVPHNIVLLYKINLFQKNLKLHQPIFKSPQIPFTLKLSLLISARSTKM